MDPQEKERLERERQMAERRARMREINREFGGARQEAIKMYEDCTMYDIPKLGELVLLEARKGGAGGLTVLPPLILYEKPGVYSREVRQIYRDDPVLSKEQQELLPEEEET